MSMDQLNTVQHHGSPIKRIKLDPMQAHKSEQLKTEGPGEQMKKKTVSLTKSNVILRKASPVKINDQTKTFYSNNPESANPFKML